MIEEALYGYGGVGILALVLIVQNQRLMKKQDERENKLAEVVENNTKALAIFTEVMKRKS